MWIVGTWNKVNDQQEYKVFGDDSELAREYYKLKASAGGNVKVFIWDMFSSKITKGGTGDQCNT